MRIISKKAIRQYELLRADAKIELEEWLSEARGAEWKTPMDIKATHPDASILKGNRVVFNICGNKHRLVVSIRYGHQAIYIRFIGTHSEYDRIDAETI